MHSIQAHALPIPPPDYEDPKDLYAFVGLAVYFAQLVDHRLRYLATVFRLAGRGLLTPQAWDSTCAPLTRHGAGQLLTAAGQAVEIPEPLEALLGKALETREYLIHRFFQVHVEDVWSEGGRRVMIDELRGLITLCKRVDQQVEQVCQELQKTWSVNPRRIEQELVALQRRVEAGGTAL